MQIRAAPRPELLRGVEPGGAGLGMEAANASRGTPHTYRGRRGAWGGQVVLVRGQTQLEDVVISPELEAPFCSQVQDFGLFWRVELGDWMFEAQVSSST